MHYGYIATGIIAAIILCWCGWDALTPPTQIRTAHRRLKCTKLRNRQEFSITCRTAQNNRSFEHI